MKAAFITCTGPADVIRYGDLPDPQPGPHEALIRVRACAVNPIDTYVRSGAVSMALPFPYVVGCDLAGDVVAVGAGVDRFRPGDRVWGSNQGLLGRQGTFAELAAVDERWLYATPAEVSDREAAAAALVAITAHLGLVDRAALEEGEAILVSGASGGVGMAVVQIAKALGARVIATAGSQERREFVRTLGADVVLDSQRADLVEAVREAAPGGVDVHWETRRDPQFDQTLEMLADGGRMVLMAGRDARPPFPVGPFYVKGCSLHGCVMFKADSQRQAAAAADINRWMARGALRIPAGHVLPLSQTAHAHHLQESGGLLPSSPPLMGKILVEP